MDEKEDWQKKKKQLSQKFGKSFIFECSCYLYLRSKQNHTFFPPKETKEGWVINLCRE